ncbi:MAG: hypothetical protein RSE05_06985 [Clostridium sp.]
MHKIVRQTPNPKPSRAINRYPMAVPLEKMLAKPVMFVYSVGDNRIITPGMASAVPTINKRQAATEDRPNKR